MDVVPEELCPAGEHREECATHRADKDNEDGEDPEMEITRVAAAASTVEYVFVAPVELVGAAVLHYDYLSLQS